MNEAPRGTLLRGLLQGLYGSLGDDNDDKREKDALQSLLKQVVQRRPYIAALALISPGGRLWASALPDGVEAESVAAMAAPVALLGRRVALEQLKSDMRQAYVEGEGGYAILRAIGEAAVLLTIASSDANLALVLHDVDLLEDRVSQAMGIISPEAGKWTEVAPSIENLRRLVSERSVSEMLESRHNDLQAKLNSLDLGFFQKRVAAIRAQLESPHENIEDLEEIETKLRALERDVMKALEQQMPQVTGQARQQKSFLRRAHTWLASMIESQG
jgi:predicted regulator of Ras-like GTPase activity (Roadblock/LC7/MglB family)